MASELLGDLLGGRRAVLAEDGRYRYRLDRDLFAGGGRVLFVMLNPSTADATVDDPTIGRCMGFAREWACGGLTVVNLYAWRATDPAQLDTATHDGHNVVGELVAREDGFGNENRNDVEICRAARECGLRVVAWGSKIGPRNQRRREVYELLDRTPFDDNPIPVERRRVFALRLNADGAPRHPLYIKGGTQLMPWSPS